MPMARFPTVAVASCESDCLLTCRRPLPEAGDFRFVIPCKVEIHNCVTQLSSALINNRGPSQWDSARGTITPIQLPTNSRTGHAQESRPINPINPAVPFQPPRQLAHSSLRAEHGKPSLRLVWIASMDTRLSHGTCQMLQVCWRGTDPASRQHHSY